MATTWCSIRVRCKSRHFCAPLSLLLLPSLPAYTMLACTRLGAVHSVVFAGFSSESLRDRIIDASRCVSSLAAYISTPRAWDPCLPRALPPNTTTGNAAPCALFPHCTAVLICTCCSHLVYLDCLSMSDVLRPRVPLCRCVSRRMHVACRASTLAVRG
jgi:hypothetical protein